MPFATLVLYMRFTPLRLVFFLSVPAIYLAACGGGPETDPFDAQSTVTDKSASRLIFARASWQCMDFGKLKGGQKIKISSTGQWSGGQRQQNLLDTLYTDANGGNGYLSVNGTVIPGISFAVTMNPPELCGTQGCNVAGLASGPYCDASIESTIPGITAAQRCNGANPDSRLFVEVPANNRGPVCSDQRRIRSYYLGLPNQVVQPNECLAVTKNRLIGKIVPPNTDQVSARPFDVGKIYESSPYSIPSSVPENSDICFRNNDLDTGLADNDGALRVTVEIVE